MSKADHFKSLRITTADIKRFNEKPIDPKHLIKKQPRIVNRRTLEDMGNLKKS